LLHQEIFRRQIRRTFFSLGGALIFAASFSNASAQITVNPNGALLDLTGYHISFSDSFSTLALKSKGPTAHWITHTPWHGDFGDAVFSDPDPSVFKTTSQGLEIVASQDANGKWRSGLISSAWADNDPKAGFTQKYGYFEMTAKFPDGMGTWPAFWLIGTDKSKTSAEIDVVEYYGGFPNYFHITEHVWLDGKNQFLRSAKMEVPFGQLSSGFNQYGVLITPTTTSFYLNHREIWSTPTQPEYRQPMYILADLALGGGWPITDLDSPVTMHIMNIKVWQRDKPWD
jgi:hypothetical protein